MPDSEEITLFAPPHLCYLMTSKYGVSEETQALLLLQQKMPDSEEITLFALPLTTPILPDDQQIWCLRGDPGTFASSAKDARLRRDHLICPPHLCYLMTSKYGVSEETQALLLLQQKMPDSEEITLFALPLTTPILPDDQQIRCLRGDLGTFASSAKDARLRRDHLICPTIPILPDDQQIRCLRGDLGTFASSAKDARLRRDHLICPLTIS